MNRGEWGLPGPAEENGDLVILSVGVHLTELPAIELDAPPAAELVREGERDGRKQFSVIQQKVRCRDFIFLWCQSGGIEGVACWENPSPLPAPDWLFLVCGEQVWARHQRRLIRSQRNVQRWIEDTQRCFFDMLLHLRTVEEQMEVRCDISCEEKCLGALLFGGRLSLFCAHWSSLGESIPATSANSACP